MADPTFTHRQLLDAATQLFGPRARPALQGALRGAPDPLTIAEAQTRLEAFTNEPIAEPSLPDPPDDRIAVLARLDGVSDGDMLVRDGDAFERRTLEEVAALLEPHRPEDEGELLPDGGPGTLKRLGADEEPVWVRDERVWLHQEGVANNGTGDQTAAIQAALNKAATFGGAGKAGVVSGPPGQYRCLGGLDVPKHVMIDGIAPAMQFQFYFPVELGAGEYALTFADPDLPQVLGRNLMLEGPSSLPTPATNAPPSIMSGIYLGRSMKLENVRVRGAFKYGAAVDNDHISLKGIELGGWAALAWIAPRRSAGDHLIEDFKLQGSFASVYCEPDTSIGAAHFRRGHMGYSPFCFYKPSTGSDAQFINWLQCDGVSFESWAYGIFTNPDQGSSIQGVTMARCGGAGPFEGEYRVAGSALKAEAVIKCGSLSDFRVLDRLGEVLLRAGDDPTNPAVVWATSVFDCDFGDIGEALERCYRRGVPFVRCTGAVSSNEARAVWGGKQKARVAFKRIIGGSPVKAGSPLLARPGTGLSHYNVVNGPVAGVAVNEAANNATVPFVIEGQARARVNQLAATNVIGTQTLPLAAAGAASIISGDLTLGATTQTYRHHTLPSARISVVDVSSYPSSGRIFVNGHIVSYTGRDTLTNEFTGCTGGSGFVARATPIGRVVDVASGTGFASAGGVADIGGQTVTYRGRTGTTVFGVTGGTGTIASGAAATPLATLKVGDTRSFKATGGAFLAGTQRATYTGVIADATQPAGINSAGTDTGVGYLLGVTGGSGSIAGGTLVVDGTTLTAGVAGGATSIAVGSTGGFPSKGTLNVDGQTVTYTGKGGSVFTGVAGLSAPASAGALVTVVPGTAVASGVYVRPRLETGLTSVEDQLALVAAADRMDAAAPVFAVSGSSSDDGAWVDVQVQARYGSS